MTDAELIAIERFLQAGCPTKGVTLSPWGERLQSNALKLLAEVLELRKSERQKRPAGEN